MGAITLPYIQEKNEISTSDVVNENQIRERVIVDGQLVSSIIFEPPRGVYLASSVLVLNDEEHVNRITDATTRKDLLHLHGIPTSTHTKYIREYILCIFQTRTLAMYSSKSQDAWITSDQKKPHTSFQRVSLQNKGKEVKRVQTLAVRALYALGLDYGVVKCGVGVGKKTVVLSVNPAPKVQDEMEAAFVQAIYLYMKQLKKLDVPLNQIVLGADPEFIMQSPKGHLLIASNYFSQYGRVGCDAIWLGQNHANKPLVEIRPDPSPDPRELAIRVYQGLQMAAKKMSNIPSIWLAGALPHKGFPIGGHVHFSGIQPNFKMLRALDNYLALMLMIAEDKNGVGRRPKYGFLGDFRYQPHGGFEYRTLPSWLVSPTLTKGVFALAKVVVANYHILRYDLLADVRFQEAYYKGQKEPIQDWVHILWEDLRDLDDYDVYHTYIDRFFKYVLSGTTWDESKDLRRNWRIAPYDQVSSEKQ